MDGTNASIGHNQGPAFITYEDLSHRYASILDRAKALAESFQRFPLVVENDGIANQSTDFIKQFSLCLSDMESARKDEKQPHLDNCRVIDSFFKEQATPLQFAKDQIAKRQTVYLRKIEDERRKAELERQKAIAEAARLAAQNNAEEQPQILPPLPTQPMQPVTLRGDYGSSTSLRRTVEIEITDRATLDLEVLRPYFTNDHLLAALKLAAKAGIKEIKGARIDTEAVKAVTR